MAAVAFTESTPFPGSAALLPVLGTAAVVAAGTGRRRTVTGRLLGLSVPRYIGRVSYGWYLWHWPCLVLAEAAFTNRYGVVSAANDTRYQLVVLLAVVLSLGLAVVSNYAVEMPVRRSVRLSRAPRLTLAFGASLTVATAALAVTLHRGVVAPAPPGAAAAVVADQAQLATAATRLSEDPAAARADWIVGPDSCLRRAEHDPRVVCLFGDPEGQTRVLLIGDSHAAAYVPGMDELATRRHWRLEAIEKNSCPVWSVRVGNPVAGENVQCERWRRNALARIASGGPYDLVLIAVANNDRPLVLRDDGSHPPLAELPRWWATGAKRTVAVMAPVARRIVVIDDPPLPGFDVPTCLSAHPTDIRACQYLRTQRAYLDADLLAAAAPGLAPFGVKYADLAPLLCPAAVCPVVTGDGRIMFKDSSHFTATYSRTIWATLGTAIDAASAAPPSETAAVVSADRAELATAATRLSEDPAAARADWSVGRNSCLSHEGVDARVVCVFGDLKSTTRVLLTGDSHAAAYVPGMAWLAARRHWRLEVIETGACPIWNFRVWHVGGMGENVGCEKWRRRALARIAASRPFDLVLIAVAESERPGVLRDDGSHPPPAELPTLVGDWRRRTVAIWPRRSRSGSSCSTIHRSPGSTCRRASPPIRPTLARVSTPTPSAPISTPICSPRPRPVWRRSASATRTSRRCSARPRPVRS